MKKIIPALLAGTFTAALLAGCAPREKTEAVPLASQESALTQVSEPSVPSDSASGSPSSEIEDRANIRIGSLKGPTSMGLVSLIDKNTRNEAANSYTFTMVTAADELLGQIVNSSLDIALVPANVASVLYNKTQGGISVLNINTLGVLYLVSADSSIQSLEDLKGKTIYLTGKGTTPDYVFNYLLKANGLTDGDVTLEYKSEPAEVAALLKDKPEAIGLLPQPFVSVACTQNEALNIVLDLTKQWEMVQGTDGGQLVTGVTIVRNEFLQENREAVKKFLEEHMASSAFTNTNQEEAAQLIAAAGIIEKAPVAQKAIPYCSITSISGLEMKDALSGYLKVLFVQNPDSVGGRLPGDDFYYTPAQ